MLSSINDNRKTILIYKELSLINLLSFAQELMHWIDHQMRTILIVLIIKHVINFMD